MVGERKIGKRDRGMEERETATAGRRRGRGERKINRET